jgi:hypothetical protein
MCGVADVPASDGASPSNDQGVLSNLPRTRPQRSSPRRAAARDHAAAAARPRARGSGARQAGATRARAPGDAKGVPRRKPAAPLQGFECDSETSGSVQPPGAVELLASAAEIVSELAKAGVSRSERLLKDLVSRLPLS